MAQAKQFGGYYPNPNEGGKVMRFWGSYGWTEGSDPTGGRGPVPGDASVSTPAPAQTTPQAGQPSGDLWGQYQAKLQPLTQRSEGLLSDYQSLAAQAPTFQQKLLTAIKQSEQYPSAAAMRAEYMQNPNLTPQAIEGLVSKRGQSTRGTIQDIINRAYGGVQADVAQRQGAAQQAQQQRSNLLEDYQLEYQSQQDAMDRLKKTGSGTGPGRPVTELLGRDKVSAQTPQYTPAKAGIVEIGKDGQKYVSGNQGNWTATGGETGSDRNKIIEALYQTTNPKESKRLLDLLDVLPGGDEPTKSLWEVRRQIQIEINEYKKEMVASGASEDEIDTEIESYITGEGFIPGDFDY